MSKLFNFIKSNIYLQVILVFLSLFLGNFLFNHVHAWLGVVAIIIGLFGAVKVLIEYSKRFNILSLALLAVMVVSLSSCERVAPNYAGVLMENYGKEGKEDFKIVTGKVSVSAPGSELFQVPLFDQRGSFETPITLKAADNTEFKAKPNYSYKVIKNRAVDIVFDNKQIGSGDDFMKSLEDNILEPRIFDLIKEESRKYSTDSLMANGGSLKFEKTLEAIVASEFEKRGLDLQTFSAQIEFSSKVRDKIDVRNEVNTNLTVIDQQIEEQRKRNELARLKAEENKIISAGITPQLLQQQFIEKWDGKSTLYNNPIPVMKVNQ